MLESVRSARLLQFLLFLPSYVHAVGEIGSTWHRIQLGQGRLHRTPFLVLSQHVYSSSSMMEKRGNCKMFLIKARTTRETTKKNKVCVGSAREIFFGNLISGGYVRPFPQKMKKKKNKATTMYRIKKRKQYYILLHPLVIVEKTIKTREKHQSPLVLYIYDIGSLMVLLTRGAVPRGIWRDVCATIDWYLGHCALPKTSSFFHILEREWERERVGARATGECVQCCAK